MLCLEIPCLGSEENVPTYGMLPGRGKQAREECEQLHGQLLQKENAMNAELKNQFVNLLACSIQKDLLSKKEIEFYLFTAHAIHDNQRLIEWIVKQYPTTLECVAKLLCALLAGHYLDIVRRILLDCSLVDATASMPVPLWFYIDQWPARDIMANLLQMIIGKKHPKFYELLRNKAVIDLDGITYQLITPDKPQSRDNPFQGFWGKKSIPSKK
jgi:hypothetical protein